MNSPPLSPLYFPSSSDTYCPTQLSPKYDSGLLSVSPEKSPKVSMKRKLSSEETTCKGCKLDTSASNLCSECYGYFCNNCINSLQKTCSHCVAQSKIPSKCPEHAKDLAYYCLDCEIEICSECILEAKDHKRHPFDRLEAIYVEKMSVTDSKIAKIGLQIENIDKNTEVARKNLTLITTIADNMLGEIQAIHDAAKMEVQEILNEKREELERRISIPVERKNLLKQLQEEINAMDHYGFIKQQGRLNEQCDKILAQCLDVPMDLIDYYDIGCELIPATQLSTFKINWIDGKQEMLTTTIDDSTGETWKISLAKGNTMWLRVAPNESIPLITSHKFKVTVEISSTDISKSLRKRFVIQRKMSQFDLATIDQLATEDYIENETILFHIAIEPLNVIEAHDHYKQKVAMLKTSMEHYKSLLNTTKESYDALKDSTDCLKNFSVGYFPLDYGSIQKQSKNGFVSSNIVDFNGNEWKMEIKFDRDEFNKVLLSAYIFPCRIVNKSESSRRCAYFIELMHSNPNDIIRGYAENLFEDDGLGRGWKGFVERLRVLNDVGFMRNGKVWFRFGVRPSA